ncbi:MAG: EamA family transporter [Planctomycetota bacterium]|nr:EamA family transporter [Planctomycetota bacterium]
MTKAILFAILAGLCWGVGEIGTKAALNSRQVGPMGATLVRALVTVVPVVIAYLAATRWTTHEPAGWVRSASVSTWLYLIIGSGLLAGFGGVFFFYTGLRTGDISILRPIAFGVAPLTAVLLGWWFLGEAMTVRKAIAVVLIVAGIVVLGLEGHGGRTTHARGPGASGAAEG